MEIIRHHNLVQIFQFLGISAFMILFFLAIDFLKVHNLFGPTLFIFGPFSALFIIRIIMIFYLPPTCTIKGCSGKMILAITRNRNYSCNDCGTKVKLKALKYDRAYKKRVHRLAIILGLIVLSLVLISITAIIRNSL